MVVMPYLFSILVRLIVSDVVFIPLMCCPLICRLFFYPIFKLCISISLSLTIVIKLLQNHAYSNLFKSGLRLLLHFLKSMWSVNKYQKWELSEEFLTFCMSQVPTDLWTLGQKNVTNAWNRILKITKAANYIER